MGPPATAVAVVVVAVDVAMVAVVVEDVVLWSQHLTRQRSAIQSPGTSVLSLQAFVVVEQNAGSVLPNVFPRLRNSEQISPIRSSGPTIVVTAGGVDSGVLQFVQRNGHRSKTLKLLREVSALQSAPTNAQMAGSGLPLHPAG